MSSAYLQLGPFDIIEERPFTDPLESMQDLATLQYMLERLRGIVTRPGAIPPQPRPYVMYIPEEGDRYHRIAIAQLEMLLTCEQLTVVGFCGQKRPGIDRGPIDGVDEVLITEFPQHPYLLSYSTMQIECGNSRNLVLFSHPKGLAHWSLGATHAQAAAMSPGYYTCIRLHNGVLPGGLLSGHKITLIRTKYYDYQDETVWWAVREMNASDLLQ